MVGVPLLSAPWYGMVGAPLVGAPWLWENGGAVNTIPELTERRQQILKLVSGHPGLTVRELGEALAVDPTSLYRPVRELTASGTLRKDGQRLYSADSQR